ncbi:serine/threonine-protein kinase [Stieleria varia]|nr:serine/threonine-protein kinase [Stieleria varia]
MPTSDPNSNGDSLPVSAENQDESDLTSCQGALGVPDATSNSTSSQKSSRQNSSLGSSGRRKIKRTSKVIPKVVSPAPMPPPKPLMRQELCDASYLGLVANAASKHRSSKHPADDPDSQTQATSDALISARYKRIGELGRGGWGVVDRAMDRQLGREVAVKRIVASSSLSEEDQARFLHEARVTSQLQHPGVVPVHELGEADGEVFYVMKLLEGDNLKHHIRSVHPEPGSQSHLKTQSQLVDAIGPLLERFISVCQAVAYAHENDVIHRDLKPTNVMVGAFGETIVVDWGLARQANEEIDDATLTGSSSRGSGISESDGTVVGTPAYMAPEQARGEISAVGCHSDIYSLGVMLYEIIAGRHPYAGMPIAAVLPEVIAARCRPLAKSQPRTPRPLLRIVETAMASAPADRYATASDLADDVRRFLTGDKVSVYQETTLDQISRWSRHHRGIAVTIAAAVCMLLIVSVAFGIVVRRAHKSEQIARREAEAAHRQALLRLVDARDAADTWLIDLSGSLEFHPAMTPIRQQLFQQAIMQYQKLIDAPIALANDTVDPETQQHLLLERLKCHLRLGDLFRLVGDQHQAAEQYAKAASGFKRPTSDRMKISNVLLTSIVDRPESEPGMEDRFRLERINSQMGQWLVGDEIPKEDVLTADRKWLRQWIPDSKSDGVFRITELRNEFVASVISAAVRLEIVIARQDSPEAPPAMLDGAVGLARELVRLRGKPSDHALSQTVQTQRARQWEDRGEVTAAYECWSTLITDLQTLIENRGERVDWLESLGEAQMRRAGLCGQLGRSEAAVDGYRRAIEDLNRAWSLSDYDDFYRTNLATAKTNLGLLVGSDADGVDEATELLNQSISTYQELLRQETTPDVLRRLAQSHVALARVLTGRPDSDANAEARQHLDSAMLAYQLLADHGLLTSEDSRQWSEVRTMMGLR